MFEFIRENEYGIRFYRNIDNNVMYGAGSGFWWADFDGSGNYMTRVNTPDSCRFINQPT